MDVIHFPDDARAAGWRDPVLALGNFDGLHRGHRKILDRLRRVAGERHATSVVMTFDPHPPRVVRPDKAPPLLMTKAQKLEAFEETGLQGAAIVRFTSALSRWDPEMFVKTVILDALRHRPHSTHFSLSEAVDVVARIGTERAYFTHISHDLGHAETCARLPAGVELAYDGQVIEVPG